ncbi:MAG: hypothetical protein MZU97_10460 [Bacillus subtilis]|nr:hypothetical protein [Bacillus subtilis]
MDSTACSSRAAISTRRIRGTLLPRISGHQAHRSPSMATDDSSGTGVGRVIEIAADEPVRRNEPLPSR